MSLGRNPNVDTLQLVPLSADPASPREGDIHYADGSGRTEGPWVYTNGAWAQFSTGAAITVVNNLTLTPQAADPGTPAAGMLFYSNGTSRAAGVWVYSGTGWVQVTGLRYQEFYHKSRFNVRAASTVNVILASQVENGDSFGGVTLTTNDLVLLKNQSTSTENGVYIVQASGAPVRSTSYDTGSEITRAHIYVTAGTNINTEWWQNNTVSNLASDAQSWAATPASYSFTVPEGVYEVGLEAHGGGGGGGVGGTGVDGSNTSGGGASGGAGTSPILAKFKTTPGGTLTIGIGVGGLSATAGTSTTFTDGVTTLTFAGGSAGNNASGATAGAQANTYILSNFSSAPINIGGAGGNSPNTAGQAAGTNIFSPTAAAGGTAQGGNNGGSAGGGGSGRGIGGAGGNGSAGIGLVGSDGSDAPDGNFGAAGGGGGGGHEAGSRAGGAGGKAQGGYLKVSW